LPVAIPNAQVRWWDAEKEADVALNQEQNGGMEPDQLPEETPAQTSSVDESRRRFTKSGLAASGVLLTITSRSVLGGGNDGLLTCKSPSGWISGNNSVHGEPPVCMGRSPGYWRNHSEKWPIALDTKFQAIFDCNSTSAYFDHNLFELCTPQKYDQNKLARHLVAAYLNAISGWTPFLPIATIKAMFTEWQSYGFFTPTAGVNWYADQIVEYLTATQG
jgi:hypothetical protein